VARIQIGEVLIETREEATSGGAPLRLASLGRRLPFAPALLWVTGGLTWALGTGILLRGVAAFYDGANLGQLDLGFLLGLPLASLGATLVGLGILKRASLCQDTSSRLIAGPVDEHRLDRNWQQISRALSEANPEASVETLAESHGLAVEEVVWTLGVLCDRGEVSEELNLDTGEWYYTLLESAEPRENDEIPDVVAESRPLTLAERLKKNGESG
jgi:hypothetical protein